MAESFGGYQPNERNSLRTLLAKILECFCAKAGMANTGNPRDSVWRLTYKILAALNAWTPGGGGGGGGTTYEYSGVGSPNGVVTAVGVPATYYEKNADGTATGIVWVKTSNAGTATGWAVNA